MGQYVPPYLNKHIKELEKRLKNAESKEAKAKEKYQEAVEYTNLCREALENANK